MDYTAIIDKIFDRLESPKIAFLAAFSVLGALSGLVIWQYYIPENELPFQAMIGPVSGFVLGACFYHLLLLMYGWLVSIWAYKKSKNAIKSERIKLQHRFEVSFMYMSSADQESLRALRQDGPLIFSDNDPALFNLLHNKYIIPLSRMDEYDSLYEINPDCISILDTYISERN